VLILFSFRRLHLWFAALVGGAVMSLCAPVARAVEHAVAMNPGAEAVIRLTSINSFWDGIGWQPVIVRIENQADRPRSWSVEFLAGSFSESHVVLRTPVAITVPARGMSETFVLVAGPGRSGNSNWTASLNVRIAGPGVATVGVLGLTASRDVNFGLIAFSPAADMAVKRMTGVLPSTGGPPVYEFQPVNPLQWPADWRVWSSFSNIVLTRDDYDALDGARRNALHEWVSQGGNLLLDRRTPQLGEAATTTLGLGTIYNRSYSLLNVARSNPAKRIAPWEGAAELLNDKDRADWALSKPMVVLVIFVMVFGVVVGPVNVFLFAPAARRQRLFWTVPLLSVGASLMLGLLIMLNDGFGGEGTRRSLVMLIPGENKAVVFQQQVARTGVLLQKEFPLSADTMLTVGGSGGSSGVNTVRELERSGDTAAGAWFTSRATQSHDLRRITPTRARVELVAGGAVGEAPVVQSSVTAVLRNFRYVDTRGKCWTASELPPGRRVTLSPTDTTDKGDRNGVFRAYGGACELAPLATHASIKWRTDKIIYTGRVEAVRQP
jgi:hypothetical protein